MNKTRVWQISWLPCWAWGPITQSNFHHRNSTLLLTEHILIHSAQTWCPRIGAKLGLGLRWWIKSLVLRQQGRLSASWPHGCMVFALEVFFLAKQFGRLNDSGQTLVWKPMPGGADHVTVCPLIQILFIFFQNHPFLPQGLIWENKIFGVNFGVWKPQGMSSDFRVWPQS